MPEIRTVFTQFNNNPSNEHYDNVPDLKFTTWNGYDHPKWIGDGTYNGGSYNSDMVNTANGLDYLFANKIQRANEAVKEQYIASGAVTSIKIKKDAVISEKIADLNVTSGKIADLAVNTAKIASAAVTGEKIAPLSITSGHIAEGGIPWSKITTPNTETGEGINTEDIANGAVTSEKLASGATAAVVSGTIRDGHVTSGKIANRAITGIKIATGEILGEHFANLTIPSQSLNWNSYEGAITESTLNGSTPLDLIPNYGTIISTTQQITTSTATLERMRIYVKHHPFLNTYVSIFGALNFKTASGGTKTKDQIRVNLRYRKKSMVLGYPNVEDAIDITNYKLTIDATLPEYYYLVPVIGQIKLESNQIINNRLQDNDEYISVIYINISDIHSDTVLEISENSRMNYIITTGP